MTEVSVGDGRLQRLTELAAETGRRCLSGNLKLATAESCTGGLISHLITEIAGSSAYYVGGVVAYSDELKRRILAVSEELLSSHGAVSAEVAAAMALGAQRILEVDVAVAVTGVAGPGGGTAEKPVGLTYVAVSDPAGIEVRRHLWQGTRTENKYASAAAAMELLLLRLPSLGPA